VAHGIFYKRKNLKINREAEKYLSREKDNILKGNENFAEITQT
jgi:hypothetical protein